MAHSKNSLSWLLAVVVGISLSLIVFFASGDKDEASEPMGGARPPQAPESSARAADEISEGPETQLHEAGEPTPLEQLDDRALKPEVLMEELRLAFEKGDAGSLDILLPEERISQEDKARLLAFIREKGLKLAPESAPAEVGELERNRRSRWGLNFVDPSGRAYRLDFDLEKSPDGQWRVGGMHLPKEGAEKPDAAALADALGVAEAFMRSTLAQEFERARWYVDPETVNDATIAGVCILFEEGAYSLREERPIRNLFLMEERAGFVAKVSSSKGGTVGDIGMTLKKSDEGAWRIHRVALDALLRTYAEQNTGGDIYFTPLVTNPEGGSSLALYFGFDDADLSERSRRQLRIVAEMLKIDDAKKLKISGHTDALGSDEYNLTLSQQRAEAVRVALVEFGVLADQIEMEAKGKDSPRRPNFLEDGRDNEQGRRVNRRAEIYLDF